MTSVSDHDAPAETQPSPLAKAIGGLKMRNIGPALMGGRIADIAVHPERPATWYVAVGSGGVWKTVNAGTTWTPVFDDQVSFSIGCVAIDPNRPETVWVGTGEAVSGRHVAWGDGVYRSLDGGKTWDRIGLEHSEHIADIVIDPDDGDIVYVAAEGPLWSSGGDRGLYRTEDGGETWEAVLTVDELTGVTSVVMAPDDPATLYAATYQRRRSVHSFVGGGPGSGIHVTRDGGETWQRITEGLPKTDMGKIGLAVTPAEPDLVYATVEAVEAPAGTVGPDGQPVDSNSGFYRSSTRGQTWERRNGYISNGTGPHYYQEIFASPHDPAKVYQVDVFLHRTIDGGANFTNIETGEGGSKHSDNHVVWIDPDPALGDDHLLVGCDGGLYESFDEGRSWRHVSNLPVSQFYRVAVDDSVPFTNILGGAQDLGTFYGPTRTTHVDGVRNQDWSIVLGADGYRAAFEPGDPDTSYVTWQVGNIMRHDRRRMEHTDIKPIPAAGEPPERWNWDVPFLISPHSTSRLYLASHRVWRTDDRGHSWTAVSDDLTRGQNRMEMATGERVWSVDALYDHLAMSYFATSTAMTESPLVEGLLYVGTDDGTVQVGELSADASGQPAGEWREAGGLPDLPPDAFINAIEASRHDGDGVFVAADNHKNGDYTPYLYESTDRGTTWRSIAGDLPDGVIVWAIEQDHVNPDLLFAGAERGLYASVDRGVHWHRLGGDGMPPIAFRDLALQRRDGDLIGASFGRGFWILDDYAPLRTLTEQTAADAAVLFPVRPAWRYVPHLRMQARGQPSLGSTAFKSPNPDFGAVFTYHLADGIRTAEEQRRDDEKPIDEAGDDVAFPGWEALADERVEGLPVVQLIIRDAAGQPVRTVAAERTAGLHRTAWDLRTVAPDPVTLTKPEFEEPWVQPPQGPLVAAGTYSVELVRVHPEQGGRVESLAGPETFDVVDVPAVADADLPGGGDGEAGGGGDAEEFGRLTAALATRVLGAGRQVAEARDRVAHLRAGMAATAGVEAAMFARLDEANRRLEAAATALSGDPIRARFEEPAIPSIQELVGRVMWMDWDNTQPPTATQRASIDRAGVEFAEVVADLDGVVDALRQLSVELDQLGGPWTPR
jgi:photosystem II stability/assembly factor-like uncharacterized protein